MPTTTLEVARHFKSLGLWPVDVPYKSKGPKTGAWHQIRLDEAAIQHIWGNGVPHNIGLLNGADVGEVGDCDLDVAAARIAAQYFLPPTQMRWGRDGASNAHWEYRVTGIPEGAKALSWKDPTIKKGDVVEGHKGMLCELGLNKHALAPGSVHPNGELLRFEPDAYGMPTTADYLTLVRGMGKVGSVSLLAKLWADGVRHDMTLPLAGMLCRGGMPRDEGLEFVRVLCIAADDDEMENRLGCVNTTYDRADTGQPYSGGPTLEDFVPPVVVARLREWLQLSRSVYSGQTGPDGWPLTDIGNAERFAARVKDKALWCDATGDWYVYDGKEWRIDSARQVWRWAMETARAFTSWVNDAETWRTNNRGTAPRDACDRHAARMQDHKHVRAMLDLAKALLPVELDEFNSDLSLLNVENGTLELRVEDGEVFLREHRPADLLTMTTGAPYVPSATDVRLDDFKARFVPELVRWTFLQEAGGASLLGGAKRHSINIIGESNSGKSMLLRLLRATLGGYSDAMDADSLKPDERGGNRPRSDLLDLRGKRLAVMAEVGDGAVFDGALFKSMFSGGDNKKYRGLYEKHGRELEFTHMLWTCGNKPYGVRADDDAAYERALFVRFEHPVPAGERKPQEEEATVNSLAARTALLAEMVEGFTRLYREKHGELIPPDEVKRETAKVRGDLNPYGAILEPDDPADAMWEFTANDSDGVLMTQAWEWARSVREQDARLRNITREKSLFESAMEQHGARRTQASTRFKNRQYWRGVRWVATFAANHPRDVTLPDWDQTQEGSGAEAKRFA
jgi:phage/plasmid-associated DNA primase